MPKHARLCNEVGPDCPVSGTLYGYYPNLPGNAILCAVFFLCTIVQLYLGIRHRLKAFTIATVIGCGGEGIGYIGRLLMHSNPYNQSYFDIQICCLVLAPSFLAASIYLTLKHLVLHFGPENSRLPPKYYPWIFISCDLVSIFMQAAGGGTAASETPNLVNIGDKMIVAGIGFQVATMSICGLLAVDFAVRTMRARRAQGEEKVLGKEAKRFNFYLFATGFAFLTIYIRCIYRVPEQAKGWGNPLMRRENEFLVLDGAMIAIACVLLTIAHPGLYFPKMAGKRMRVRNQQGADVADEEGAHGLVNVEGPQEKMWSESEAERESREKLEIEHGVRHARETSSSEEEEAIGAR